MRGRKIKGNIPTNVAEVRKKKQDGRIIFAQGFESNNAQYERVYHATKGWRIRRIH